MGPRAAGVQGRSVVLFSSRSAVLILKDSRLLLPSQPGVGVPACCDPPSSAEKKSRCIWIGVRDFFSLDSLTVQCSAVHTRVFGVGGATCTGIVFTLMTADK